MEMYVMFVAPIGRVMRHDSYIRVNVPLPMRQEDTVWATVFLRGSAERLDRMHPLMQDGGRLLVAGTLSQLTTYHGRPSVTIAAREWQFIPRHADAVTVDETPDPEPIMADDIDF